VNEQTDLKPYLHLAISSNPSNKNMCELLIKNGASLHSFHRRKRVFDLLRDYSYLRESASFKTYRNALIQELLDTFKYSDYEKFKQRVIESIDNEEVIVVDADHLDAIRELPNDEKDPEEVIGHLQSLEFRERFIVDYLNVLSDQNEHLKMIKLMLTESFPDLKSNHSHDINEHKTEQEKQSLHQFKLKDLVSGKLVENLIHLANETQELGELSNAFVSINECIKTIGKKLNVGRELLELVERKFER
jgi:hypothetical protein